MKISVAIITKDRLSLLSQCLKSIEKQTYKPDEVIIIDNGSINKAADVCKSFSNTLPIKYIYETIASQPKARNLAIDKSSCEIILCTDDDCEADEKWVETIKKYHTKFPNAVAIQGSVDTKERNLIAQTSILQFLNNILLGYLQSGNLSLNKIILRKLELSFDESLPSSYDFDLALQMVSKNGEVHFARDAIVYHNYTINFSKEIKRYFTYGFYDYELKKKHPKKGMRLSNALHFLKLLTKGEQSVIFKVGIFLYYLISSIISIMGYMTTSFLSYLH